MGTVTAHRSDTAKPKLIRVAPSDVPPSVGGGRGARRNRGPWFGVGVIAACVAGLAIAATYRGTVAPSAPRPFCPRAMIVQGSVAGVLRAPGSLAPKSVVRIGSLLPGQVTAVNADVGDRVARGQVLARLDNLEQRLALVGAAGQLTSAEIEATRAQRELNQILESQAAGGVDLDGAIAGDLLLDGPAGDAQLDLIAAVAKVAKQEALLTLNRRLNERRVIRAPMAGVVLSRSIAAGETVPGSPPGPPLFVIGSDPGELRMTALVDQRHIAAVRPGSATITTPVAARALPATVQGTSAVADAMRSSAAYEVALDVGNPDGVLAAGMTVIAALPMSSPAEALRVPTSAVQETASGPRLSLVAPDGTVVSTAVMAGVTNDVWTEVAGAGLAAGHLVLAQPGLCPAP